jgi:bifunctional non-homologous end joining protein LigD
MLTTKNLRPHRRSQDGRRALSGLAKQLAPAAMSEAPLPMLCTLVAQPFDNPDWIFEPKYDGLRVLGRFDGQTLTLLSRNQTSQNFQFPDIVEALGDSLSQPVIVDGEIVCLDEHGQSSFRSLQQRFHLKNAREVQARSKQYPAYLYLFDLLYVDDYDLTALPLKKRKELLQQVVEWSDRVRWTPSEPEQGSALWQRACHEGNEGIIGKHLDSPYVQGRSPWWVKIKCIGRQEFVIGGFTDPQRSRVGLGALLVGYYSEEGQRLIYAGKVGTGYTHETLLDLRERLDQLQQRRSPFDEGDLPAGRSVHWVQPRLVAEIAFAEWTQHGLLRQPRFEGLRPDKKPEQCRRERPRSVVPDVAANPDPSEQPVQASFGDTTMALEKYEAKRDFAKTPEPPAEPGSAHPKPIFVIQEHHASRLHYDFRLEADGVLKSWAVPKQPSMDPAQKRLAVHVEDHPLGYADFEGTIPEGQYGAGKVSIWDRGHYENLLAEKPVPQTMAEGMGAGRLEFVLQGKKLKGRFALIRMHGRGRGKDNWLLIKMKDELARPEPSGDGRSEHKKKARRPQKNTSLRTTKRSAARSSREEVTFTNRDKLMYPEEGITKGDVIEYYRKIGPHLLPFLHDRPATLERLPEGLGNGKAVHFWQKNTPTSYPDWIARALLPSEQGRNVHYVLVNNLDTLLYLVNQGTLTFHVWFSRIEALDRPDFVLFDLDPGQATFGDAVTVARELHAVLKDDGSKAYLKTSGKTGLHVLVPWDADGGYDEARAWAQDVDRRVVETLPEKATTQRSKARRGRRVYVDVMQNARGRHAVPPYVLRAVPQATVSTPLNWNELTPALDPAQFSLKTIFRRLARQKRDPMADLTRPVARKGRA